MKRLQMLGFSHKDAWGSVEYKATTDALDARTLIMTASIPLNELAVDYDAQRVAQLRADVDTYANKRGIVQVVFRQGASPSSLPGRAFSQSADQNVPSLQQTFDQAFLVSMVL
jgi:hypothetical protein